MGDGGTSLQESKCLAGIFSQIVTDCKGLSPEVEALASQACKFSAQLRATASSLSSLMGSLQKVADKAASTTGSSRDVGCWLNRVCQGQRGLEAVCKGLASSLLTDFVEPLKGKNETFKKSLATMDKQHRRGYRKKRTEMKKKAAEEQKLHRKLMKQEPVGGALEACRRQVEELQHGLEEQEREAVEAASQLERQQFLSVARALQPVLEQQAVLACNHLASTSNLSDLITSLTGMTEEGKTSTAELDSMIRDLRSAAPGYSFTTPPPSPATSLQGSRRGSISSIGSASSLQRPSLSSLATSPSPHLSRPRPALQRSLSHASDRERSRRLSSFSLRGEDTQSDFHSEEFERSLEAGHSRPSRPRSVTRPAFSTVRRASSPFRCKCRLFSSN
jgi:hypothetical protein